MTLSFEMDLIVCTYIFVCSLDNSYCPTFVSTRYVCMCVRYSHNSWCPGFVLNSMTYNDLPFTLVSLSVYTRVILGQSECTSSRTSANSSLSWCRNSNGRIGESNETNTVSTSRPSIVNCRLPVTDAVREQVPVARRLRWRHDAWRQHTQGMDF